MIEWRPPSRADDGAWLDLLEAIDVVDGRGERYTGDDLDDEWTSAWAHPATDATFGWEDGELVAFGWLKVQPGAGGRHRIAAWGGVRPSHRRRGMGTELLAGQLARATAIAATLDAGLPTDVEVEVVDREPDQARLVEAAGLAPTGRLLELARPLQATVPPVALPPGLELRPWSEALDEPTRLAHNAAFAGQKVQEPHDRDRWRQWLTGHRSFCPELSVAVVDADAVVGYVLSGTYPSDWERGPREVWLTTVGTRPEVRRRGVARAALTAVLVRAAAERYERAVLGVDADNPTGAVALYRSLGFGDLRSSTTYTRRLDLSR